MHSEIDTLERVKILRDLRQGEFDVLIGINLLREGLDLPEVSLVAILDADKEGFLRSAGSLIQTIGRCARNLNGRAILYADHMTDSMNKAINETDRRRAIQQAYNEENGITPQSIIRSVDMALAQIVGADYTDFTEQADRFRSSSLRKTWTITSRSSKPICAKPPSASNSKWLPNCAIPSKNFAPKNFCSPNEQQVHRVGIKTCILLKKRARDGSRAQVSVYSKEYFRPKKSEERNPYIH